MTKDFDKSRCLANIYHLAKDKGIKLGDLETKAGVSVGYISRINKDDSTSKPSIDFLTGVAAVLDISLDALLYYDFEAATPSEAYLLKFIDRLYDDTMYHELPWDIETYYDLKNSGICEYDGKANHPLFTVHTVHEPNDDGPPDYHSEALYNSAFRRNAETTLCGDSFKLPMTSEATLYLMKVEVNEDPDITYGEYGCFELYMVHDGQRTPLCTSDSKHGSAFDTALMNLYDAVVESSQHSKIQPDVKEILDDFMHKKYVRPNQDLPVADFDPDIPF